MLFPPILESTLPAFVQGSSLDVPFQVSDLTSRSEIKHIQIRLYYQSNNKTIGGESDGITYLDMPSSNKITISAKNFKEADALYGIQLRFGSSPPWVKPEEEQATSPLQDSSDEKQFASFAEWKKYQVDKGLFSEWSTVMMVKCITKPFIEILNAKSDSPNTTRWQSEYTKTPTFWGTYRQPKEILDQYKFTISSNGKLIEDSGWLQYDASVGTLAAHRFKTILSLDQSYTVKFFIKTVNGYEQQADEDYTFVIAENYLTKITNLNFAVEPEQEDGCLAISLSSSDFVYGLYVLIRQCETDGVWEDIKNFFWIGQSFDNQIIFRDYTVECGLGYRYAIQKVFSDQIRSSPLYEDGNNWKKVYFEYSYLYRDGVQIPLRFNTTLSSFKHTVLAAKQDTLGGKYPTITRNGTAYYAEFPINGLISLHADYNNTVLVKKKDGYYCRDVKVMDINEYDSEEWRYDINITDQNIRLERLYREKVEEFLNDGEAKLFRSATEGNIVVALMNVSFTPNTSLSRMIANFSCNAYEIADNTVEAMTGLGVINLNYEQEEEDKPVIQSCGQVSGLFKSGDDLKPIIEKQQEFELGTDITYKFNKLTSITIEPYPIDVFDDEINYLKYRQLQGDDVAAELEYYEDFADAVKRQPDLAVFIVDLDGKQIVLSQNRIYHLHDLEGMNIGSISLSKQGTDDEYVPFILNYTCELERQFNQGIIITHPENTKVWGQLAGIFTTNEKIIERYGTDNIYNGKNIMEFIKTHARKQIENIKHVTFVEIPETGEWVANISKTQQLYYNFEALRSVQIEADEGTAIWIQKSNSELPQKVYIGSTQLYTLNPSLDLITDIWFDTPTYALINYQAETSQLEYERKNV